MSWAFITARREGIDWLRRQKNAPVCLDETILELLEKEWADEAHGMVALLPGLTVKVAGQNRQCIRVETGGNGYILQRGGKFIADLFVDGVGHCFADEHGNLWVDGGYCWEFIFAAGADKLKSIGRPSCMGVPPSFRFSTHKDWKEVCIIRRPRSGWLRPGGRTARPVQNEIVPVRGAGRADGFDPNTR
jgi:hypothetical protein